MAHFWIGPILMSGFGQMLLGQGHSPTLSDRSIADLAAFPGTAQVAIWFLDFGLLRTLAQFATTSRQPEWGGYNGQGSGAIVGGPYEIRLTVNSGSSPNEGGSDTTGSWLSLSASDRYWGLTRSSLGSSTGVWFVEIRSAATSKVLASATYTMSASLGSS